MRWYPAEVVAHGAVLGAVALSCGGPGEGFPCSLKRTCPEGFSCAPDSRCYTHGRALFAAGGQGSTTLESASSLGGNASWIGELPPEGGARASKSLNFGGVSSDHGQGGSLPESPASAGSGGLIEGSGGGDQSLGGSSVANGAPAQGGGAGEVRVLSMGGVSSDHGQGGSLPESPASAGSGGLIEGSGGGDQSLGGSSVASGAPAQGGGAGEVRVLSMGGVSETSENVVQGGSAGMGADSSSGGSSKTSRESVQGGKTATSTTIAITPEWHPCSAGILDRMNSAVSYLRARLTDRKYEFSECLNRAFLVGAEGMRGWDVAELIQSINVDSIGCDNRRIEADPDTRLDFSNYRIVVDETFGAGSGIVTIAGALIHEIVENRGFGHGDAATDPHYKNSVPAQAEACIVSSAANAAVAAGYMLFSGESLVLHEPTWDRVTSIADCEAYRQAKGEQNVDCFYDGRRMGYELFLDGHGTSARLVYVPGSTAENAATECFSNVQTYGKVRVECLFDGSHIGYELYRNGRRDGWALLEDKVGNMYAYGADNCAWNATTYPKLWVQCFYRGTALGYELFRDGSRVSYGPNWSIEEAKQDCKLSREQNQNSFLECHFDGSPIDYNQ